MPVHDHELASVFDGTADLLAASADSPCRISTPRRASQVVLAMAYPLASLCLGFTSGSGAAAEAATSPDLATIVRQRSERIEYRGLISHEANAAVFGLFDAAQGRLTTLLIESEGGSAEAAMELGSWLFDRGLTVQIDEYCLSSCANYVFTAARRKVLSPRAALMWHGGFMQAVDRGELECVLEEALASMSEEERSELLNRCSRVELLGQLERSLAVMIEAEQRYFRRIGVDRRITVLGQLYERELLANAPPQHYVGWDFSLEDLAKLGVDAVEVEGGATWNPDAPVPGARVYRITLAQLPDFRPAPPTREPRPPRR